ASAAPEARRAQRKPVHAPAASAARPGAPTAPGTSGRPASARPGRRRPPLRRRADGADRAAGRRPLRCRACWAAVVLRGVGPRPAQPRDRTPDEQWATIRVGATATGQAELGPGRPGYGIGHGNPRTLPARSRHPPGRGKRRSPRPSVRAVRRARGPTGPTVVTQRTPGEPRDAGSAHRPGSGVPPPARCLPGRRPGRSERWPEPRTEHRAGRRPARRPAPRTHARRRGPHPADAGPPAGPGGTPGAVDRTRERRAPAPAREAPGRASRGWGELPAVHTALVGVALPGLVISTDQGQLTGQGLEGFYRAGTRLLARCGLRVA